MKQIIFVFLLFGLVSCQINAPTFKSLGQWRVASVSGAQVTVTNVAYLYNPNKIDGMKLNGINLAVQADGMNLGKFEISQPGIPIPKLSDFEIPVSFIVNISDLIGNLPSILSIVTGKTIDIRCIGKIDVGYLAFSKSIVIDQTVPLNIKDIK